MRLLGMELIDEPSGPAGAARTLRETGLPLLDLVRVALQMQREDFAARTHFRGRDGLHDGADIAHKSRVPASGEHVVRFIRRSIEKSLQARHAAVQRLMMQRAFRVKKRQNGLAERAAMNRADSHAAAFRAVGVPFGLTAAIGLRTAPVVARIGVGARQKHVEAVIATREENADQRAIVGAARIRCRELRKAAQRHPRGQRRRAQAGEACAAVEEVASVHGMRFKVPSSKFQVVESAQHGGVGHGPEELHGGAFPVPGIGALHVSGVCFAAEQREQMRARACGQAAVAEQHVEFVEEGIHLCFVGGLELRALFKVKT